MRESTARESGHSVEQLRERVATMRAEQGLPPFVENATTLQHIADLMRSDEKRKRRRRKAGA